MERNAVAKHRIENCSTCMHSWRPGERKSDHRKSAHVGPGQFILNVEKDRHYLQFLCVQDQIVHGSTHGVGPVAWFAAAFLFHPSGLRENKRSGQIFLFPWKRRCVRLSIGLERTRSFVSNGVSCSNSIGTSFQCFSFGFPTYRTGPNFIGISHTLGWPYWPIWDFVLVEVVFVSLNLPL